MADIDVKGISVSPPVSDIPARSDDATIRLQSKDDAARQHQRLCDDRLLVGLSVLSIMRGAALPVWQTAVKREGEAELIFCGEQYAQAISLFQRRFAGTFPPGIDVLVKQRASAHDAAPVWVAIPSPYDSFIHCTSPV